MGLNRQKCFCRHLKCLYHVNIGKIMGRLSPFPFIGLDAYALYIHFLPKDFFYVRASIFYQTTTHWCFLIGHWACYILNKCKSTLLHLLNFEIQPSPVAALVFNLPYVFEFISPLTITIMIEYLNPMMLSFLWCYYEIHLHHEVCKPLKYSDQSIKCRQITNW